MYPGGNVDSQQEHLEGNLVLPCRLTGVFGSTITVLITTIDDSVWLMPFIAAGDIRRNLTLRSRLIHAGIFLATLMSLSFLCCILALGVARFYGGIYIGDRANEHGIESSIESLEIELEWISVLICWILASVFFVKKQLKKRRKSRLKCQQRDRPQLEKNNEAIDVLPHDKSDLSETYGSLVTETERMDQSNNVATEETDDKSAASPMTVASLTLLGFLDEISYFPTLIIGNIFTISELMLGTFLAGLIVLGIQVYLFRQCKPLMDFLDERVPLYGIISCFAVTLTARLIWDIRHADVDVVTDVAYEQNY